jgi:hypothetical protein
VSRRYTRVRDGQWVHPKRRGYKLMCCDCGLVHRVNFKIETKGERSFLSFQAFRDTKATKLSRRQRKRKHAPRK